jgi:hypothetical protein
MMRTGTDSCSGIEIRGEQYWVRQSRWTRLCIHVGRFVADT